MKTRKSKITPEVYEKIKLLQSAGVNATTVAKIIGVTATTISYVYRSKDHDDYKRSVYKPNKNTAPVSVIDTDVEVNIPKILRQIATYLEKH